MQERPQNIDPVSAVSYWEIILERRGYHYTRDFLDYTYLRKVKSKKRRHRVNVYYTVSYKVAPRYSYTWIVELPPRKKAPLIGYWIPLMDYRGKLEEQYETLEITPADYFYRHDEISDYVKEDDGFIWKEIPKSLTPRGLGGKLFAVIASWTLMHHIKRDVYFFWRRARRILPVSSYDDAYAVALEMHQAIINEDWVKHKKEYGKRKAATARTKKERVEGEETIEESETYDLDPYLEVVGDRPIAWTAWLRKDRPTKIRMSAGAEQVAQAAGKKFVNPR